MTGKEGNTGSPGSPPAPIQYTFVNQHEDLPSVLDRRIHNEAHRHDIRSHVMRGVRHNEQTLGRRRPTGRPPARTRSTEEASTNPRSTPANDDAPTNSGPEQPYLDDPVVLPQTNALIRTRSQPLPWHPDRLYHSPGSNLLDPFDTMPRGNISQDEINSLKQYCRSTFLPMSLPVEKQASEQDSRWAMVVKSYMDNPAAFFGFMATWAAHRAILHRHHEDLAPSNQLHYKLIPDLSYQRARQQAVQALQEKLYRGDPIDGTILEACFGFISQACIVGDFQAAHGLLSYIHKTLKDVEVPYSAQGWLPMTDIKAAVGMLTKPIKALPWAKEEVPADVLERVRPPEGSPTSHLGTAFRQVRSITPELRQLLDDAVIACHFCEFNANHAEGLTYFEHVTYRCKTHELEHATLSYVCDIFPFTKGQPRVPLVPPLEQLLRMTILGMMSIIAAVAHPATGLGRALTHHQKNALDEYLDTTRRNQEVDPAELRVLVWALFVFAQCADEQVERPEFQRWLVQGCARLEVATWEEVEQLVLGCLYVPSLQGRAWREVWETAGRWMGIGQLGSGWTRTRT